MTVLGVLSQDIQANVVWRQIRSDFSRVHLMLSNVSTVDPDGILGLLLVKHAEISSQARNVL